MTAWENRLKRHAQRIKAEMKTPHILLEKEQIKSKKRIGIKKWLALAAVLALCLLLAAVTPWAHMVRGYFEDVFRIDGAVVGSRYENASGELQTEAGEVFDMNGQTVVPIRVTITDTTRLPFSSLEELRVSAYNIFQDGKKIKTGKLSFEEAPRATLTEGKCTLYLPLGDVHILPGAEYTLAVEELYGYKKADTLLPIGGIWECTFQR